MRGLQAPKVSLYAGLVTDARSNQFIQTVEALRTLEDFTSPTKLQQMYKYQREARKEYARLESEIKREYWQGELDPVNTHLFAKRT